MEEKCQHLTEYQQNVLLGLLQNVKIFKWNTRHVEKRSSGFSFLKGIRPVC